MVKVITDKKIVIKKVPLWTRFVVTLLMILGVFMVAFTITYLNTMAVVVPATSYEECVSQPSSKLEESYPAVCIAKDGTKFIEPLAPEEEKLLESTLSPV